MIAPADQGGDAEDLLCADALADIEYLKATGVPAQMIVICGHPLGSGVAINLAR